MNETEYWLRLEYRLSREFGRFLEKEIRFLWCDLLEPDDHVFLPGEMNWLGGMAQISEDGGRSFVTYRFKLQLGMIQSKSDVDWLALLPSDAATGWLRVDRERKELEIQPPSTAQDSP